VYASPAVLPVRELNPSIHLKPPLQFRELIQVQWNGKVNVSCMPEFTGEMHLVCDGADIEVALFAAFPSTHQSTERIGERERTCLEFQIRSKRLIGFCSIYTVPRLGERIDEIHKLLRTEMRFL
jgi:hypothetical protein